LNFLARFYLDHGSLQHAVTLFNALLAINPNDQAARYHLSALQALRENSRSLGKRLELQEKIIGQEDQSLPLGLRRDHIPCLIEMNGDLVWLPGDLLRFLWHTVQKPLTSATPSFQAETTHYVWIRDRLSLGDVVLDIGSNIGIFATMMGAKVGRAGRVFAFEPSPKIAADLRRVLALNELSQVTVVEAAASNRSGEATFCEIQEADVRRESSHLSDPLLDSASRELKQHATVVKTLVIDDFVAEHALRPVLMKIDVEGAEFLVLEGAEKTIGACKPKLVIEIHPNSEGVFDHARLTAYLKRFGYQYATETKTYYCW
jgi:FkbM family methyltransferase